MHDRLDTAAQRRQKGGGIRIFRARAAILGDQLPTGRLESGRQKAATCFLAAAPFNTQVRDVAGNQQLGLVANCRGSSSLSLDPLDGAPQPVPHCIFDLFWRPAFVKMFQYLPLPL